MGVDTVDTVESGIWNPEVRILDIDIAYSILDIKKAQQAQPAERATITTKYPKYTPSHFLCSGSSL